MMKTTTKPFLRLQRMVTKRRLKDYCLLEQMLILNTLFVIFMIVVMNDVFKDLFVICGMMLFSDF